jgi:hypothetical protein
MAGMMELHEATHVVGRVAVASALLEQAIAYLEWQLRSFSEYAAASQRAIRHERHQWSHHAQLDARLKRVKKAFEEVTLDTRIQADPQLILLLGRWGALHDKTKRLGNSRNDVIHGVLAWKAGKVVRTINRPWSNESVVDVQKENALADELGTTAIEVGSFTTELGRLLPFVDQDQIIAA